MKRRIKFIIILMINVVMLFASPHKKQTKTSKIKEQLNSLVSSIALEKDSNQYYMKVANAILLGLECEKQDAVHSAYVAQNKDRLVSLRTKLVSKLQDTTLSFSTRKYITNVIIESASSPLFKQNQDNLGAIFYNTASHFYSIKNYKDADFYVDKSLLFKDWAEKSAELKVLCMKEKIETPTDSTVYLLALLNLHTTNPNNSLFFHLIIEYLSQPQYAAELEQFTNEELLRDSKNVQVLLLWGEIMMTKKKWNEAIEAFTSAEKLGGSSIHLLYNIGISYSSKALEYRDNIKESGKRLTQEQQKQVRDNLNLARKNLELVKEQDPECKKIDWRNPLYVVLYALKDKVALKSLAKIMPTEK